MKIAILFGGNSNEHEVSIKSFKSIIKYLDKTKYDISSIYLDKNNNFYKWNENKIINNPFSFLKNFDVVFIMIHGKYGEDGTLSAILDFLNIPYVGNKMLESAITMDKVLTKEILETHHILTTPYLAFLKYNNEYLFDNKTIKYNDILKIINNKFSYPLFVKPANSGSSIGISKVINKNDLSIALDKAFEIDNKILIEQEIVGKEIECGLLEKDKKILTSILGEVKTNDFYSYEAKYNNVGSKTIIPANIDNSLTKKIQEIAEKAFKILNLHGYSRCDFLVTLDNQIYINEINSIPGFTEISMYPKLFENSGISYSDLLDILINEAKKK